jgi:hypothetical protein
MNRSSSQILTCSFLLCFMIGLGLLSAPAALGQYDVTGNGTPDLLFVQPLNDGRLQWFAQDLIEGSTTDLGVFGQQGWDTFIAAWEAPERWTRTTVRRTAMEQLFLGIPEREEELSLGTWSGGVVVNAGRDSNGNGTADAVLIVKRDRKLSWRFIFDPFTVQGSFKRILFGTSGGDVPFLFRARGTSDALAIIVRNQIIYRGLNSSLKRRIRLSGFSPVEAPRTVRGSDGRDTLLFPSENAAGLLVTSFKGKKKSERQFDGTGTLLIGDATGSGEETYGVIRNTGELELVSGETFEVNVPGVPAGGALQKAYKPEDISGTPLPPTASGPGGTGVVTVTGGGVTGTPVLALTLSPTGTQLPALPTSTPVVTSTPPRYPVCGSRYADNYG